MTAIAMVSAVTDYKTVRDAMVLGAADYLGKDMEPEALILSLRKMMERRTLLQRHQQQNFEARQQARSDTCLSEKVRAWSICARFSIASA